MSLQVGNKTSAATPVTEQVPHTSMEQRSGNTQAPWSFHTSNIFNRGPIGRNVSSEALAKLQKAMEEIYKNAASTYEVQLVALDNNNQTNLAFSVLVVCLKDKSQPEVGVAYYPMIIEASGEKIPARFENIGGNQYEVYRVTGQAMDGVLASEIHKKLATQYPNQRLWTTDGCVIPDTFKLDNPDQKGLHQIAVNAGLACHTELLSRSPNFVDMRLTDFARDSNLVVTPRYENKVVSNTVGQPIRSDVQITFTSQQSAQNNSHSVNDSGRVARVSQVDAFVDLVWAPVVDNSNMFGTFQPNVDPRTLYQKYAARLIITRVENEYLQTLPSFLLSLVAATIIREQNNWSTVFRPRAMVPNTVDLHDIGAINLECMLPNTDGKIIDTKEARFGNAELATLINTCVRPGLIFSIDVEDTGPDTWCTSVFSVASNGSPKAQQNAQQAIFNAANHLTNGAFQEFFNNGQMFVDAGNRVHIGNYTDANGVKRDIRDLDYLAILNLTGSQDLDVIKRYSDTFTNMNQTINQRLSDRKRILSGLVPGLEITGYATRVTFSDSFISALVRGCQKAGLTMRSDLNGVGVEINARGTFDSVGAALSGANPSGLFSNQVASQASGVFFNPMFSRFGN